MATVQQGTIVPAKARIVSASRLTIAYSALTSLWSDGKTLLGSSNNNIGVSGDQGATLTLGHNFGAFGDTIESIMELPSGEVLVSVKKNSGGNTTGELWLSSGWVKSTAQATSWTRVLTASGPGNWFDGRWAATWRSVGRADSSRPSNIFVIEYGTRVIAAATASQAAIRAWWSQDGGATWTVIWTLTDEYDPTSSATNFVHNHGIAYDPYDDVVWLTQGDGGGSGGSCGLWYCYGEDLATAAANTGVGTHNSAWHLFPGSQSTTAIWQTTSIVPMDGWIVLLPDGKPFSVNHIRRSGRRRYGSLSSLAAFPQGVIGAHAWRNWWEPSSPLLLTVQPGSSIVITHDGETFTEAYRDTTAITNGAPGLVRPLGPDASGLVYANSNLSGTGATLVGTWSPDNSTRGPVVVVNGNGPLHPTVAQENFAILNANANAASANALVGGQPSLFYFTAEQDLLVSRLTTASGGTAGAALTLARMGLYTISPTGDATLVAQTASDTTMWTAASTIYTKALDTTGGYPAAYQLRAGQRYAVGCIATGTTMPRLIGLTSLAHLVDNQLLPRHLARFGPTGQTDLPTSILNASFLASGPSGVNWCAVAV